MLRTITSNTQPDDKIEDPNQQPTQPTRWDIEDDIIDKEEELQQQMLLVPNPLTQPNQSIMPSTRTHSQAMMSEQIKQQSESPSQGLRCSPRASQQPIVKKSNHLPAEPGQTLNQPKSRTGPPSSAKKKLQLGDSKAQPKQVSQSHDHPGSCVMNKVKIKPEEDWNIVDGRQSPCKREAPPPSPTFKAE